MNAISFDTHAAANTLGDAGFTKAQVEALVEITRQTTALPDVSTLSTKTDFALLKSDFLVLKSHLTAMEAGLSAKIESAKLQAVTMILSGVGAMLAIATVVLKAL